MRSPSNGLLTVLWSSIQRIDNFLRATAHAKSSNMRHSARRSCDRANSPAGSNPRLLKAFAAIKPLPAKAAQLGRLQLCSPLQLIENNATDANPMVIPQPGPLRPFPASRVHRWKYKAIRQNGKDSIWQPRQKIIDQQFSAFSDLQSRFALSCIRLRFRPTALPCYGEGFEFVPFPLTEGVMHEDEALSSRGVSDGKPDDGHGASCPRR